MEPVDLSQCDVRPDIVNALLQILAQGWYIEYDRLSASAFRKRKSGALFKNASIRILVQEDNQYRPFYVRSEIHPPAKSYDSAHQAALRFIELCMAATPDDKHAS